MRLLDGGLGYVDLDRLETSDVDGTFERLKNARGIIFDMRGYPRTGTLPLVVRKLNRHPGATASLSQTPLVMGGWTQTRHSTTVVVPPPAPAVYQGPTVMLIDERAQSAAEAMGMYLKAAADTVLIGSPTTGANGETVTLPLPGGFTVRFTANDARHPDGTQLQRVGLKPDIEVLPTIAGINAGRDEVLERAVAYLTTGR